MRRVCPKLESTEAALGVIAEAVEKAGYSLGKQVFLPWMWPAVNSLMGKPKNIFLKNQIKGGSRQPNWSSFMCSFKKVSNCFD